jgi:hypothetical protein
VIARRSDFFFVIPAKAGIQTSVAKNAERLHEAHGFPPSRE